ncbi:MAG: carotenoid biosynthesis protein [Saprospiraceae bacterium]
MMYSIMQFTERSAIVLLGSAYLAGIIGIGLPIHPDFVRLTPFNLLLTTALALYFHPWRDAALQRFAVAAFAVGFGVEALGVNTGFPFGAYAYGEVLGFKVLGTPPLIGVNWLLTAYCVGAWVCRVLPASGAGLRAAVAAAAMTALDILIEPVAIRTGMWTWEGGGGVPPQNYIAWFVVGFGVCYLMFRLGAVRANRVAMAALGYQILFFTVLNIWT